MDYIEYKIPCAWGQMAAKIWGDRNKLPILCIHGFQDNANSFDALIPHLTLLGERHYFICVDLPGHGKSTPFPQPGGFHIPNTLLAFVAITKHFAYGKYRIIAHSYGGFVSLRFAQLYPERVERLFLLDVVRWESVTPQEIKIQLRFVIDGYLKLMDKFDANATYNYADVLHKMMTLRRYGPLDRRSTESLLERIQVPTTSNGKIQISKSPLIKYYIDLSGDEDYGIQMYKMNPLKCPAFLLLANESRERHQKDSAKTLDLYKTYRNIEIQWIDGTHEVHMMRPERVAVYIHKFFLNLTKL